MVGGVQLFGSLNLLIIIRYIYFRHKLYICSKSRYLDRKKEPKKTKEKADNKRKRKEKTRESEKRSYGKERLRKKKENIKENQQAVVYK